MDGQRDGLICAYRADAGGRFTPTDWDGVDGWRAGTGMLWVHLDRKAAGSREWVETGSGLPRLVTDALLQEETRPRLATTDDGLLVILRGVNLNPGANPEDMVSIRLWLDSERVISLRGPPLLAVQDLRAELEAGGGPGTPGALLVRLAEGMTERMAPVISALDEGLDAVEEQLIDGGSRDMRGRLVALRREGIILRRYIAPQREVLARLAAERHPLLSDSDRARLREAADRVTRYVEDLESVRDRAAVAQEELANRLSDQMNRTMYVLSLVATVFLPLGFVTGLLGVNVGGIPGTDAPAAFALLCLALFGLALVEVALFRLRRWL